MTPYEITLFVPFFFINEGEFQIEKAVGVRLLNQRSVPSSEVSKILEENGFKIKTSFRTTITQEGNSSTLRIFKSRDQLRPNIGHLTITVEPTERSK